MEADTKASKAPTNNQYTIDFEEERHEAPWSSLYQALVNLEKLLTASDKNT